MFYKIFILELKKNLLSPAFYIFFLIFFITALIFTLTTDPYTQFVGVGHGREWHNAPIIIAQILTRMGIFGLLFTMVIIGRAVAKDFEVNIHELIFSRPVSKFQYLGGRLLGSILANLLLFTGIILGFEIGIAFLAPEYSGPFSLGGYLLPMLILVIPNLLLMGSIMFSLAALTRKMVATYIAGIAFLAVYAIIGVMLHRMDNETLKVLLDPFGLTALTMGSKYWTVADMNNLLMPINTTFLVNRLIWLSASLLILWYTFRKFQFVAFLEKKRKKLVVVSDNTDLIDYDIAPPQISVNSSRLFTFSQCINNAWGDFKKILLHPAFLILTFIALTEIATNFIGGLGNQSGHPYRLLKHIH